MSSTDSDAPPFSKREGDDSELTVHGQVQSQEIRRPPNDETSSNSLGNFLVSRYSELRRKLSLKLGSAERADDVLHETYLKVSQRTDLKSVSNPQAYLLQTAANLAIDKQRADRRLLSTEEVGELLEFSDEKPGPELIASSQIELQRLKSVLMELPERQRNILLASRLQEEPHQDIARRYGVSVRTVELEIKRALTHCSAHMERKAVQRFGPRLAHTSERKRGDST